MMKHALLGLTAVAVFGSASPALAQEALTIPYRDLDLATAEGQQALDRRIDTAVRKFCSADRAATGSRIVAPQARKCYAETMEKAKAKVASIVEEGQLGG